MISRFYKRLLSWFEQPASPVPLAWFRIMVALFCILRLLVLGHSFLDVYGQYGFVQWAITRANLYDGLPHLGNISLLLGRLGLTPDQSVHTVLGVYVVAILGLMLGLVTRWMAALAWFCNFLLIHAGGGLVYGMDIFTHIALFYLLIMPAGNALSLDVRFRWKKAEPSVAAGITRRMLQLHLCIIYFSSGLEKAAGIQWWNGEAIWRSVTLPTFVQFDMHWLAYVPWLPAMIGWSVLILETGYAFFVWRRSTRMIWLPAVVAMHFSIGLFLGMWLFGLIMIIMNLGAFGYEAVNDWVQWRARFGEKKLAAAAA
jgi:hypothetical protein